jgi:hypothetical protein
MALLGATFFMRVCVAGEPVHSPLHLHAPLQDKNFYFLSLLQSTPAIRRGISEMPILAMLLKGKRASVQNAASSCKTISCMDASVRWTDQEIGAVATALELAPVANRAFRQLDRALRESGAYVRYKDMPSGELLAKAWTDAAIGMNEAIDEYGEGKPPRYPTINAAAFDVRSTYYALMANTALHLLTEKLGDMSLFFEPTLGYVLYLLEINKRDEAARLEPLDLRDNAAAIRRVARVNWSGYPYTVIIVPGEGPDRQGWPLAPQGKLRLEMAARRWRDKKAPFILVSGGYVYPNGTAFAESVEMKRSLMMDFGVPDDAILIDPQARHTTTNLRNAAREIYRYKVPFDRPALVVTDEEQSAYIESSEFLKRCETELGFLPGHVAKRLSIFDLIWLPNIESLQIDAAGDLLDP